MSIIRVVDTYHIPEPPPDIPKGTSIRITVFVAIKSGDASGPQDISLRLLAPDGKNALPDFKWPVILKGEEHGANLKLDLQLPATASLGVYWCHVVWQEQVLGRFPIKLARAEKQAPQAVPDQN